jgi:hypothetical protein
MTTFRIIYFKTLVVAASMLASSVQAEVLGLPNGRLASPAHFSPLSVELGFVTGDFGTSDYQNIGARVNFRATTDLVIHGDIGASEYGNADGTPFGLGVIYHLANQRISQALDIAAKASYHSGEYKVNNDKLDLSSLSFEALLSGRRPLSAGGLGWYGNFGYHRVTLDLGNGSSDSSNEIGIGGGLVLPATSGETYIGLDLVDELTFSLGFRYFIQ